MCICVKMIEGYFIFIQATTIVRYRNLLSLDRESESVFTGEEGRGENRGSDERGLC